MKARIRPVEGCALIWNYSSQQEGWPALQAACEQHGLRLQPVDTSHVGHTIGALCQLKDASPVATLQHLEETTYPPALILHGLERKKLDGFLKQLHAGQVKIPLKAMVTPSNQNWTLANLLQELCREREEFAKRAKAAQEKMAQNNTEENPV